MKKLKTIDIISLAIGVIGIALSIYFYLLAEETKEPTFVVDPIRTEVLSKNRIDGTPIRVILGDSTAVAGDLTFIRFYFWNAGKEAIHSTDILDTLRITLSSGVKIVQTRILSASRDVCKFALKQSGPSVVELSFRVAEQDDGFTGEFLVEGTPSAAVSISGTIEGSTAIQHTPVGSTGRWFRALLYLMAMVLVLAICGFMMSSTTGRSYEMDYDIMKHDARYDVDPEFRGRVNELEQKFQEVGALRKLLNPDDEQSQLKERKRKRRFRRFVFLVGAVLLLSGMYAAYSEIAKKVNQSPKEFIPSSVLPPGIS